MAREVATDQKVSRAELEAFVRPRHRGILITRKRDGGLQSSPVTMGIDTAGRIVISSYPERAKSKNLRRDSRASLCVLSDDFGDEWVHVDGTAEVIEVSDAVEPLVEYFRVISGEHSDWDEYRRAMIDQ
ncbi:MAG TPA: PPOX class F420-dependent oxidoreductase, partial [Actinobacteria bacterium]|nr:PPOX class F420-dependent oxidoreductase [Actinomycetota bacterium]